MKDRLIALYTKYLQGKNTKVEFLEMKRLISKISDAELESMMQVVWDKNPELPHMPLETKNRIKANLPGYAKKRINKKVKTIKWWNIAAIAVLIILSGVTIYLAGHINKHEHPFIVKIESGQKANVILPDNSNVRLNADTRLEYDLNDKKQRKVYLSGEAFFKVERNEKRPFIVDMGELQIEVLGTSFNVQTYENEDFIETSLVEGSVKLSGKRLLTNYYLKPMEQMIYYKSDGSLKIIPLDNDFELGWMIDRLVFNSEPLHRVIHQIERWYGVTIDLQCAEIKNDLMSGSFYKEELKDVLEAISIQYNVKYTMREGYIIISKN